MRRVWLSLLLGLTITPAWAQPWKLPKLPWDTDWSKIPEERRLVLLRPSTFAYEAEASPEFDYGLYLPRRYRVEGMDDQILAGISLREGFPIRMRGRFTGDRVKVDGNRAGAIPALLPVPPASEYWRGNVLAIGVSQDPPRARLEVQDGREWVAQLEFESVEQKALWQKQWQRCWLRTTCWRGGSSITATDILVMPPPAEVAVGPDISAARFLGQASELFLERVSQRFLKKNPQLFVFQDPFGAGRLTVDRLGITLQNCPPKHVRLYGRVSGNANVPTPTGSSSLQLIEGEWEAVAQLQFQGKELRLRPLIETLEFRLTRPLFLQLPVAWTANLGRVLSTVVSPNLVMPIPGAYSKELLETGVFSEPELSRWALFTRPSGDRRSSFLAIAGPVSALGKLGGPNLEPGRSRLREADSFALILTPEAINRAFKTQIPRMLPLKQELPPSMRKGPSVLFLTLELQSVEITQLELAYTSLEIRGIFSILNCVTAVNWKLGPISGVEPGAQAKGLARIHAEGRPLTLSANTEIQSLEFLSPHIRQQSPEEQQRLRQQIVGGLKNLKLQLPLSPRLPLPMLGPNVNMELTGVECLPREFILRGQLSD